MMVVLKKRLDCYGKKDSIESRFGYIDIGMIMSIVVALLILAVGIFAFGVVLDRTSTISINDETQEEEAESFVEEIEEVEYIDINPLKNILATVTVFIGTVGTLYFMNKIYKSYEKSRKEKVKRKCVSKTNSTKHRKEKPFSIDSHTEKKTKTKRKHALGTWGKDNKDEWTR